MAEKLTADQYDALARAYGTAYAEKLATNPLVRRHPRTGALIEDGRVMDSMRGFGSGLAQGVVGLTGLPGDVERLGRLGINAASKYLKRDARVDENPFLWTSKDMLQKAEHYAGPFYQAQTMPGRFFQTIGEYAPGVLIPGGQLRSAAQIGGHVLKNAVVPAIAAQTAYELAPKGKEDSWKAFAGAVTGIGTQYLVGRQRHADNVLAASLTPADVKAFKQLPPGQLFSTSPRTLEIAQEIAVRKPHQGRDLQKSLDWLGLQTPVRIADNPTPTFGPAAMRAERSDGVIPAIISAVQDAGDPAAMIIKAAAVAGANQIWDRLKRGPSRQAGLDYELMNRLKLSHTAAYNELDRIVAWQNALGYKLPDKVRYGAASLVAGNAANVSPERQ